MQQPTAVATSGLPLEAQCSTRSYVTAVSLSAVFGFIGVQHFYLGRHGEGLLDVLLSIGWMTCFVMGEPLWGLAFIVADFGHSFVVTIMLLTGSFRDGDGRVVCYPGQKLKHQQGA